MIRKKSIINFFLIIREGKSNGATVEAVWFHKWALQEKKFFLVTAKKIQHGNLCQWKRREPFGHLSTPVLQNLFISGNWTSFYLFPYRSSFKVPSETIIGARSKKLALFHVIHIFMVFISCLLCGKEKN